MAYSTAYQTVVAGRVREDEAIPFFRNNEVATPSRITSFNRTGGSVQQPVIKTDYLNDPNIAKPGVTKDPDKSAFATGSNNLS